MVELIQCADCGQMFMPEDDATECTRCHLDMVWRVKRLKAAEKPQRLLDMEHVWDGGEVTTDGQKAAKALYERNMKGFSDLMLSMQESHARVVATLDGEDKSLKDERHGKLKELIEECRDGLREVKS